MAVSFTSKVSSKSPQEDWDETMRFLLSLALNSFISAILFLSTQTIDLNRDCGIHCLLLSTQLPLKGKKCTGNICTAQDKTYQLSMDFCCMSRLKPQHILLLLISAKVQILQYCSIGFYIQLQGEVQHENYANLKTYIAYIEKTKMPDYCISNSNDFVCNSDFLVLSYTLKNLRS